jgi:hypothetical protein
MISAKGNARALVLIYIVIYVVCGHGLNLADIIRSKLIFQDTCGLCRSTWGGPVFFFLWYSAKLGNQQPGKKWTTFLPAASLETRRIDFHFLSIAYPLTTGLALTLRGLPSNSFIWGVLICPAHIKYHPEFISGYEFLPNSPIEQL